MSVLQSKEFELKLQVPRECLHNLHQYPTLQDALKAPAREEKLVSTYFDSDEFDLRENGISLRVRRVGDHKIQTIKISSPIAASYLERREFEREITGDLPDLSFAADSPLSPVLTDDIRSTIRPIFETQIDRKAYRVGNADADIEIALDDGQIVAGASSMPVSEIEIELKRGDPAQLFGVARSISSAVPARLIVQSKAERGYDLITQRRPSAAVSEQIALTPDLTAAQGFKYIAQSCIRHIIANQAALIERDAKALHQMRIGLRRLRIAISVFSNLVADDQLDSIKVQLRQFGRELAHARDLEVLLTEVLRPFRRRYPSEQGFVSLSRAFGRERTKAYKHAAEVIGSDTFQKFMIDCMAWVEAGPWTTNNDPMAAKRAHLPITVHAAAQILRRRKKCRKLGRMITKLDPGHLHELRLRTKKLRYTAEFFQSLYQNRHAKRSKKFLAEARNLQDALGGLNDVRTRRALFADMVTQQTRTGGQQRAFAAGLIVGQQDSRVSKLTKEAVKAFSKLDHVKSFWKHLSAKGSIDEQPSVASDMTPG
jgi:inorganic triphosphatase YgiF